MDNTDWFGSLDIDKIPWAELIRINPVPFLNALTQSLTSQAAARNETHSAIVGAVAAAAVYNLAAQKDQKLAQGLKAQTVHALHQAVRAIEAP